MKKTKRLIYLSIFLAMVFAIAGNSAWATTFTATSDGNWSDATIWDQGSVPTSVDDVNLSTYTVTVDGDYTIDDLTIGNGGVLQPKTTGTYTLTITGNITCTSATPNINGSNSNGRLNIVIDNSTTKAITAGAAYSIEFYNLTLTEGSAITLDNSCKLEGDLVVNNNASFTQSSGTFQVFGTNSTITNASLGSLTFYNLYFASTATNASTASNFTVAKKIELGSSAKFNASAGTITLTSTANEANPINYNSTASDLSFNNVTFSASSGTFKPATSFTVKGNMTVTGGVSFYPTAGTVEFDNNASINDPKTITLSGGTLAFFNLKVTDGSNVKSTANVRIDGNSTGGNSITVEGTGSLVITGTTTFYENSSSNIGVSVANSALLQLGAVSIANPATFSSSSNLVLTGNFTTASNSSATFSSPSIVAFKDTTGQTGNKTITNGNSTNTTLMFNSIYVYDDANTTTVVSGGTNTFTITGDIYVYGGSTLDFRNSNCSVVLMGSTAKTFYNEGTLKFYDLYIENTSGNILNTSSNFEITNDLHALGSSSSAGAINASSPSIITFSKAGDPIVGTNINAHSFYSLKAGAAITAATAGNNIQIKGDLIKGSGSIDFATAGNQSTVKFNGTTQQKIVGDVRLDEVTVDNSSGLVLEGNLTLGKSGTESSTLTISNGYVDLNGNYYIAFDHYGNALSESSGKVVKNSKPGTGYISTASSSYTDINASGIGVSNLTNGENIIVRRYYGVRIIDGLESITRYYRIYSGASPFYVVGTGIRLAYDESELNGNTEAQLTAYMSANPDAYTYSSDASTTTTSYHNWTHTSATVTAASNYVSLSAADVSSSASFTTGGYFMIAPKFLKIAYFPTTDIDKQNKVAESPLVANSSNKTILGFSLTPTMRIDASTMRFTALNVDFSRSPSGIFSGFEIYKDNDQDLSTVGKSLIASGSLSGNTVQFASLAQTFTAGQTEYYFIVADVDATVNSSTPSIYASIDQDGITMNNIYKMTQTINGPTYSFGALNVTLSSANSPSAGPLDIGTTNQTIYGFKLTPPANSSVTFNTVNIKVTVANGAEYDDFENWKLYTDNNKNGIVDGDDTQEGSTVSAIDETTGILSFTITNTSLVAGEDNNYILVASVKTDANANGTVKAQITSSSDVTLTSPATIPSGGPYQGNTMTIRSSSGTPTRLSITAFSMKDINGNSGRDYDLKAKGENEVVVNENLVIQVKAVDANGRPQKLSQATTVTLTPLGGGTVSNNTISMSINTTTAKSESLKFTTASTSNQFSLIASATSGETLTPDTLTGITVYSLEPSTSFFAGLSISSIQATTATISWTNSSSEKALVVMKAGGWPADPEDGVDYNSSANFSSPASSNGTTGTGSVVVYEGTGSSVNVTGLSANTTYYVVVYKFTGSGIGTNYLTWDVLPDGTYNDFNDRTQFTTKYSEPTAISTNMTFSNVTDNSMKITWTKPSSGGGTYSLVVIGTSDPSTTPTDTNTYTASTTYGDGSPLGTGSTVGYVVYKGGGNSVTVSGLSFDTRYYVRVYEFNGSAGKENYLTTQYLSDNRYTLDKEPEIQASNLSFSDMTLGTNTSLTLRWVRGNGDKCLVVGKAGSAITANETPDDQSIAYTSESSQTPSFGTTSAIGQGYALYFGTANSITVSGLQYGQTYYFKVFEYNEGSGTNTTTDNSTLNYNTDDATNNPNSRIADSYEPNDDLADAKFIQSDGTLYSGLLTSADDVDWFSFRPDFENSYDNIRIKLTGLPKNYTLELYRADGRLLRRSKIVGTSDEIVVLNNLPEADYYVKIYSADGEYSLTPYRVYVLHRTSDYNSDTQ